MNPRTQERVEQWDSRPFSDGASELSRLAANDFSGAVCAAGTWVFVLNGRAVGVFGGTVSDLEDASGTIYETPHPSLPLLYSMKERGGETRATYYTNETPLEEVDRTLKDGSFTGYVELSENVLSGDYYAVYYGGRRMAAAFIGNAERLLTGEEAFDRAADEVGIYSVVDVDIKVTDLPNSSDEPTADAASDATDSVGGSTDHSGATTRAEPSVDPTESAIEPIEISGGSSNASEEPALDASIDELTGTASTATESTPSSTETDPETATELEPDTAGGSAEADADVVDELTLESTPTDPDVSVEPSAKEPSSSTLEPEEVEAAAAELERNEISWSETDDALEQADSDLEETDVTNRADSATTTSQPVDAGTADRSVDARTAEAVAEEDSELEERFEEEAQWRETRRIPSIDPEMTSMSVEASTGESQRRAGGNGYNHRKPTSATKPTTEPESESRPDTTRDSSSRSRQRGGRSETGGRQNSRSATPKASTQSDDNSERVVELEQQNADLQEQLETLEAERERLRSKNERLTEQTKTLQSRIDELERKLENAGSEASSPGRKLSAAEALSGTNLFVRYSSKSKPTLRSAHDENADRNEVAKNLRLEHHTEFDEAAVSVDGQPYEEFLTSTMAYRCVDWLAEVLLCEIRDTGHANKLPDLYDAIPRIDRIELNATISLADDDTEDVPDEVAFDIVAFDKMGNPLIVVVTNDSREPASESLLTEFEAAASAVKVNYPDLAAAVAVTSSYFAPGALEVTEQATSSGILSRSSKASYVNTSRKDGYHLCLVESRSEGFHMTVPEL